MKNLEAVTDAITNLIADEATTVVDLSCHDRRADVIELRFARSRGTSGSP
jgi:hypothetical protein